MRGHSWRTWPARIRISYPFCGKCGLIRLKNALTEKAVRAPCPGDE